MGKLFCLMGKSASGKDTLYKKLLADNTLKLHTVCPYTTRPPRNDEKDGREYHFVTKRQMAQLETEGRIIENRAYDTVCGIWHYFTADDGQFDLLDKQDYLLIGTLETYGSLCGHFGPECVVPLYITVEDGERLARALHRERQQEQPRYEELCRRFLADERDFSKEALKKAGITKQFYNESLEQCLNEIRDYIQNGGEMLH